MTMFGSQWFAAPDTTYTINQSARFNNGDSAYLNRTPGSAGNRRTWTWSGWVKRTTLGSRYMFGAVNTGTDSIGFASTDLLTIGFNNANDGVLQTTRLFRDVGAWYHIVVAVDTTESTATNRIRLYVNGVEETDFSTDTAPAEDYDTGVNNTVQQTVGSLSAPSGYLDGYLAEVHLIDGSQLTAASFGETNSDTGQWIPKAYSGSYGTNGFYLKFQDSSSLGDDSSGNGNDFTSNNLAAADQMSDSPTNNFWTLNPLDSGATISDGNLKNGGGSSTNTHAPALPTTGKWYWEVVCTDINTGTAGAHFFGICNAAVYQSEDFTAHATISAGQQRGGQLKKNNSNTSTGTAVNDGNTVGMAFDADNLTLKLYVDGSQSGSTITSLTAGTYKLWIQDGSTVTNMTVNFGQSDFDQTVPTGYSSLCTNNLPDPQVENPSKYFHTQLYTGDGSSGNSITNNAQAGDFQPDLLIIAPRSNGDHHNVWDAVRGNTKRIRTNAADTEYTDSPALITFESDGFDLDTTDINYNGSSRTYCAWQWSTDGASAATNTDGSRDSSVMVNTTHGFSIVAYTGDGSGDDTYGHGLGATPGLIWCKNLDAAQNWRVFNQGLTSGAANSLFLNLNNAESADPDRISAVSSTTFTAAANMNKAEDYIAYCWAPVPGYSAFGNYEGNSNADGTFIYTEFRPAWITVKTMDSANDWVIYDTKRDPINVSDTVLRMDSTNSEYSGSGREIDILSNGFKMRTSNTTINASATFAYMAFAEFPFKYANAR